MLRLVTGGNTRGFPLAQVVEKYLRTCGNSPNSIRAKTGDLNYFVEYVERVLGKDTDIREVAQRPSIVRGFQDERERRNRDAPATLIRRFKTLKRFFNVAAKEISGLQNPTEDVTPPSLPEPQPDSFSEEDLKKMLAVIRTRHYAHDYLRLQDELIIYFGIYCGFRGMDIRTVRIMHFDPTKGFFMGLRRKANNYQDVPIRSQEIKLIEMFLPVREAYLLKTFPGYTTLPERIKRQYPLLISPRKAQLLNPDSWQMNEKTVWNRIKQIGKEAGVKIARPHMLRHTSGRMALDAGNDIVKVSQFLGHQSLHTTMCYVQRNKEQVKDMQSNMVDI